MKRTNGSTESRQLNCAVYTRKSTEEGLEQEFNSLDAQRASGEAYILSQAQEGWYCLPDQYDDGGFTGGNMERPALKRLLADIEDGKVDCVVVYKVDRLSRSLLDFARMLGVFERHHVAFVSVTQQFNTTNSMGRLMLNVLLSFAQFEREIISERTRDKIAAARRRGKWSGGMPLLGYDVNPEGSKLSVNESEAVRVRAIYDLYLDLNSIMATIAEIDRRGWTTKRWTTRKGNLHGGKPFNKSTLFKLLTNVTYLGKLKYKDEVHEGEQAAIVDPDVWQRVQQQLKKNGRTGGVAVRNRFGALLKGLLRCVACNCAMTPSHSSRRGTKRYRYYVCTRAQKRGWQNCPAKSIPAEQLEKFVVEQVKSIAQDSGLIKDVVTQAHAQTKVQLGQLEKEQAAVDHELANWNSELRRLVTQVGTDEQDSPALARLADMQDRIQAAERRALELSSQVARLRKRLISAEEVGAAMTAFDDLWEVLAIREQIRIIQLIVEKVDFDGRTNKVTITFHAEGLKQMADVNPQPRLEVAG